MKSDKAMFWCTLRRFGAKILIWICVFIAIIASVIGLAHADKIIPLPDWDTIVPYIGRTCMLAILIICLIGAWFEAREECIKAHTVEHKRSMHDGK